MSDDKAGNEASRLTTAIGSIADVTAGIEEQFGRSPNLQLELDVLCRKHGVTDEGRRIIETIRQSDPERNVGSGAGNFSGRFPSVKSRFVQQWESKDGERKRLLEFEYDPNVLEYYAQPMAPKYEYVSKTGRKASGRPTIDFFVISQPFLGWEEFKPESKLIKLAEQNPIRYVRNEDGAWNEPPLVAAALQYGLGFRVATERSIPHVLVRNLDFLREYLDNPCPPVPVDAVAALTAELVRERTITLARAIYVARSADSVYWGLISGFWEIDIRETLLCEPDCCMVHLDRSTRDLHRILVRSRGTVESPTTSQLPSGGEVVTWDGVPWVVANAGASMLYLREIGGTRIQPLDVQGVKDLIEAGHIKSVRPAGEAGTTDEGWSRWKSASIKDQWEASDKSQALQDWWEGRPLARSDRTLRYWQAKYEEGLTKYGNGLIGLLEFHAGKGNRTSRLTADDEQFIEEFLDEEAKLPIKRTPTAQFADYVVKATAAGRVAVGKEAFEKRRAARDAYSDEVKNAGAKNAYKIKPARSSKVVREPPEGDRAFAWAHIDHTQSNIFARLVNKYDLCARPWLTLLICAYTRLVLGWWLGFQSPSTISCFMALRDCVRRHHRLPAGVIHDGGKEFDSVRLQQLLAHYRVETAHRPTNEPRFGNPVERLNLDLDWWLCRNTIGNNFFLQDPRSSSKSHDPRILTQLNLPGLASRYERVLFVDYPDKFHDGIGSTPLQRLMGSQMVHGQRSHVEIGDYAFFRYQTLMECERHRGAIDPRTGVRVSGWDYFHDDFRSCAGERLRGKPRFDLEDPTYIEVNLAGHPLRCELIGSQAARLTGSELKYAYTERLLRIRHSQLEKAEDLKRQGLRLAEWRAEEEVARSDATASASGGSGTGQPVAPSPTSKSAPDSRRRSLHDIPSAPIARD